MKPEREDIMSGDLNVDEDLLDSYEGTIPGHLAIIMDGNGRWARRRDLPRIRGHRAGAQAVRSVVEACRYLGVDTLTLYAFSSQNWQRPPEEVAGLMTLFEIYLQRERERLLENDIRLEVIGNRDRLAGVLRDSISEIEEASANNDQMVLQIAVSYGGREEIVRAARGIAREAADGTLDPDDIDDSVFEDHLYTAGRPDPELVIRTSGEMRISNFLLWQIAYSELYITDTLWPDFDESALLDAFHDYEGRERRFGKTGAQVETVENTGSDG
jgi:undecaprenyl diphosphate synthase